MEFFNHLCDSTGLELSLFLGNKASNSGVKGFTFQSETVAYQSHLANVIPIRLKYSIRDQYAICAPPGQTRCQTIKSAESKRQFLTRNENGIKELQRGKETRRLMRERESQESGGNSPLCCVQQLSTQEEVSEGAVGEGSE